MTHLSDDKLLNEAMELISQADCLLIEIKNPMGQVIHHMADSILCYIEEYIYKNKESYGLSKPLKNKGKRNDDSA